MGETCVALLWDVEEPWIEQTQGMPKQIFFVVIFTYASLLGSIPLVHGQACDNAVPHCKTCRRSIVSYREEARVPELAT